ncbi:MAG TPA: bifunctional adenosylcobinamide kinase/adenosylcobinamide-phosphate guanylyltransferase [Thermodesulfobacteriota bacterium]|jgi:adenosylcobinamide kinase/adenosylcobinamide-phosphate guanylyltransferase|nr:bifunctional adenosylcobinamide kinase/adenosylcobinamide-phosphate guanylyltransferase [Thermodesulfobacteriota bacterium]
MSNITLITGGGRSGKSRHALEVARAHQGKRVFIATAEPFDDEMRKRIRRHRDGRGESFLTIEEPLDPGGALLSLTDDVEVAVVDCLTVWLGNLMHYRGNEDDEYSEVSRFLSLLDTPPCNLVIVTNEVGMGIIPHEGLARRFRDMAGFVNQEMARRAHRVILMVSGIPIPVK